MRTGTQRCAKAVRQDRRCRSESCGLSPRRRRCRESGIGEREVLHVGDGFVNKTNLARHSPRASASRWRTTFRSSPLTSPAITSQARRSISAPHSDWTSGGSWSKGVSRLTSNSAARSARSTSERPSASRRRSSDLVAMPESLPHYANPSGPAAGVRPSGYRRLQITCRRELSGALRHMSDALPFIDVHL
jgi:hypothetical protein